MTLDELFPEAGRILLTGGGKEFVEQIGVEAIRKSIVSVMLGENIRTQTEPLSRRKIAIVSGALLLFFARGHAQIENFSDHLSELAIDQLANRKKRDKASTWLANWVIGLTGKQVQNVLRSKKDGTSAYIRDFETALTEAAKKCQEDFGNVTMELGFLEDTTGKRVTLDWTDIARLTTAISSQTLTLRGADKSMYGKLFERLILGSLLTILGFQRVDPATNDRTEGVFWLSDSRDLRECDATLLIRPGQLVRFDIGFIGPGNSEISKDKLSRWLSEVEFGEGSRMASTTFIIVDRLPKTRTTERAAERIGAEIIQMSMQYWVRELSRRLRERCGIEHELQNLPDDEIEEYLRQKLNNIAVENFLSGVSIEVLTEAAEQEVEDACADEES